MPLTDRVDDRSGPSSLERSLYKKATGFLVARRPPHLRHRFPLALEFCASVSLANRSAFKRAVFSRIARARASYSAIASRPSRARSSCLKLFSALCRARSEIMYPSSVLILPERNLRVRAFSEKDICTGRTNKTPTQKVAAC